MAREPQVTLLRRFALTGVLAIVVSGARVHAQARADAPSLDLFFAASSPDERVARAALDTRSRWRS